MNQPALLTSQEYQVGGQGVRVRDLPASERPVNRLLAVGPGSLSNTELLAAVLQTPDALTQAQQILGGFGGLRSLSKAAEQEITHMTSSRSHQNIHHWQIWEMKLAEEWSLSILGSGEGASRVWHDFFWWCTSVACGPSWRLRPSG